MKIFITGGAGFIGRNLRDHFLDLTDYFDGDIFIYDKATYSCHDVCNSEVLIRKVMLYKPDVIIHLAAFTNVIHSIENPMDCIWENVLGMLNVLSIAKSCDIPVLFTSSGAANNPISPYGKSKLICEYLCEASGCDVTVLRLSNVYGKYSENKTSVIAKFYREIMNEKEITVFGRGNQSRDFVNVGDVCRAIDLAIPKIIDYHLYEIGSGVQTTINELVSVFNSYKSFKINYKPEREGELKRCISNIERAGECLGYKPEVSLREGVNSDFSF